MTNTEKSEKPKAPVSKTEPIDLWAGNNMSISKR